MAVAAPTIDSYAGGTYTDDSSISIDAKTAGTDRLLLVQFGAQYWRTWSNIYYAGAAPTGTIVDDVHHNSGHDPAEHEVYYWNEDDLAAGSNTLEWDISESAPNSHYSWILLTGVSQTDPFCDDPVSSGARAETFNLSIGTVDTSGNVLALAFGMAHGYGWNITTGTRIVNAYSGCIAHAADGGDTTTIAGTSGEYPPNSGIYGIGIKPPQNITVTLTTPAAAAIAAYIGIVDDGNIIANLGFVKATASAIIGGVLEQEPIVADMYMELL